MPCCAVLALQDEVITPPIPQSWSMWYMGYGPGDKLQHTLNVVSYNISYLLQSAEPGQLCPIAAWGAYWTMRTHAIPVDRCVSLTASTGLFDTACWYQLHTQIKA